MDRFENYPPNPTDMEEELYKDGVNILYSLIKNDGQTDDIEMNHIEAVLNSKGVDAALYLLYYGHRIREDIYGSSYNDARSQREFKTLLQTAASIGAMISREKLLVLDKLDSLWNI